MKALILHSVDGQDYCRVILHDSGMISPQRQAYMALEKAKEITEDWTWDEHLAPSLVEVGFIVPEYSRTRTFNWDE